jgi:hypothetical protein
MRYALALSLLLLPATAFAQMFEGPTGQIPVEKCRPLANGAMDCVRVENGEGMTASRGFQRADRSDIPAAAIPAPAPSIEAPHQNR